MSLNIRNFKVVRDAEGQLAYGIYTQNVRKYVNDFAGGETLSIPISEDDGYALFLPTPGANFQISDETPIPTIPSVVTGNPMQEVNLVPNAALIDLTTWFTNGKTTLYIKSDVAQEIGVLVYSKPR